MTNLIAKMADPQFRLRIDNMTRRTLQRLRREQQRDKAMAGMGFYRVEASCDQPSYDGMDVMSMLHPAPSSEWLKANVPNTKGRRWRYGATMSNAGRNVVWFEHHDDAILFKMKFG